MYSFLSHRFLKSIKTGYNLTSPISSTASNASTATVSLSNSVSMNGMIRASFLLANPQSPEQITEMVGQLIRTII